MTPAPGLVVWLTGRPASGKSTLARALETRLRARGLATLWLDSDSLRRILTPEPTYDDAERKRFYGALAHLAALAAAGGAVAIVSATAARRAYRDACRAAVGDRFVEVWVRCDLETLRARDPKGLYGRAARDTITRLPGVGVPYEPPEAPELVLDTADAGVEALADRLAAEVGARTANTPRQ